MENITMTGDNGTLGECSVAFTSGTFPTSSAQGEVNLVYTVTMKENANYVATTKTVNVPVKLATYSVQFVDATQQEDDVFYTQEQIDNKEHVLKSETLDYGATITAPNNPSDKDNAKWNHEFLGWYNGETKFEAGTTVSGPVTYTAKYSSVKKSYDVVWLNEGKTIKTENLAYGTALQFTGETPVKEDPIGQYSYTFIGWNVTVDTTTTFYAKDEALPTVAEKTTLTAVYEGSLIPYEIKFTVDGKNLDSYMADVDTDPNFEGDTEVIADGYFHESEYRSAPYFDLKIDGITLLNDAF
jgi:hypothetical protein